MSFSLGHRLEHRQSLGLHQSFEQRLTHAQQLAINIEQLERQRGLIEAVHGTRYDPKAECRKCHHKLTDFEIMKGFNDDPHDFTTKCPKCAFRFEPRLFSRTVSGSIEMAFYCPAQTLAHLQTMNNIPLDEFRSTHGPIYHSAVAHFGGLKQAFSKLGMIYKYETELDWKMQVVSFLGKMPDTVIAELVGTHVCNVRRLRVRRNIPVFSRRREAEILTD